MPVVATITLISLLAGRDRQAGLPFSNPTQLRSRLYEALDTESGETLQKAKTITYELENLLNQYRLKVDSSLDAYIEESSNRYTAAPELIQRLKPLDQQRSQTLQRVIALRQSLFELLSDEQWEAVFKWSD